MLKLASIMCFFSMLHAIDFNSSMGKNHVLYSNYYQQAMQHTNTNTILSHLQTLYLKNSLETISSQAVPKIPKIIHQIWLGSPFPEKYNKYQASWQKLHPKWIYKLWTDKD